MSIVSVVAACGVYGDGAQTDPDESHVGVAQSSLDKATTVAPTSGWGDPTTVATVDANGNENWVGGAWYVPLPVSAGDVVGTFSAVVRDNGTSNGHQFDGNNVIALLQSRIAGSTSTLASASSNGSGTQQTLTITTTHTVATGEQLVIEFFGLKGGALPSPSTVPSMTGPVTASPRGGQPSSFLVVAGGAFQFIGNIDAVTQLYVAQVDALAMGAVVTAGSVAVQCQGPGGGYFRPCTRTREIGGFACGPAVACGTSASAPLPFPTPFVAGSQSHLDVAFAGVAPTLIPTTAVIALQ